MMSTRIIVTTLAIIAPATVDSTLLAQPVSPDDFLARTFTDSTGFTIPFRLFVPPVYDPSESYPIVMYLHGSGGRGTDNLKQITGGNTSGATVWAEPANQTNHPAFVLAPQAPLQTSAWGFLGQPLSSAMRASFELLNHLETEYNIDAQREYVTGQSMGGSGTWAALGAQPDRFAAGVPLAGTGNPSLASVIATIPQWIFHGAQDTAVPVDNSRQMVAALGSAGGSPIYTEYDGLGHGIWDTAYGTPELQTWLFVQMTQVPELEADFDGDGDVDGADFDLWQAGFDNNDSGDADSDGNTDGNDFLIWQQEHGTPVGSLGNAAIPEPASITLLLSITALALARCRRRRS